MFGLKKNTRHFFRQRGIKMGTDEKGKTIVLRFGNAQHIGRRNEQEDSFGYTDISDEGLIREKGVMAVLADGMGGLSDGKTVSNRIVSDMIHCFENLPGKKFPEELTECIDQLNQKISRNTSAKGKASSGSTLACVVLTGSHLYWAAAGDSRIYLMRDGRLYQLNEDHDYLNQLLERYLEGEISLEKVFCDPQKDSLTSYIGEEGLQRVDYNRKSMALQKSDVIFLCSDGVYNALTHAEMIACLQYDPHLAAEKAMKMIWNKKINGQDNMTALVMEYNIE